MTRSDNPHTGSESLRPLSATDGDPAFAEPWQAEALAMADTLIKRGLFSASTWSAALGDQLRRAERSGQPDTSETYYQAVLAALEHLVAQHSEIDAADMQHKREEWEAAYLATPHGRPVVLGR